jgi:hypothetical protein
MHKRLHAIVHHPARVAGGSAFIGCLAVLAGWIWAHTTLVPLGQPVIVTWSASEGILRTVPEAELAWHLAGIGGTALLVVIVNGVLAVELERRDRIGGKFVALGTFAFAALIFIAFAAMISVN